MNNSQKIKFELNLESLNVKLNNQAQSPEHSEQNS
jgi:hypothetical protein